MTVTHTILIWLFPFYLITLEVIFRFLFDSAATEFIGPAIATAGIGFLLPLTKPREAADLLSTRTANALTARGGVVVHKGDQQLIPIVWIFVLIGFLVWFGSCYSAQKRTSQSFLGIPEHICVGSANYIIAAVLAGLKSRL